MMFAVFFDQFHKVGIGLNPTRLNPPPPRPFLATALLIYGTLQYPEKNYSDEFSFGMPNNGIEKLVFVII